MTKPKPTSASEAERAKTSAKRPPYLWLGDDRGYPGDDPVYVIRFDLDVLDRDRKSVEKTLDPTSPQFRCGHFYPSWLAPDCLYLDGKDQWIMDDDWPAFCSWIRKRVALVHEKWPVLAVSFGDELDLSQKDAKAVRARVEAEQRARTSKKSKLVELLQSGTPTERLRAASHAATLLRDHHKVVLEALEHGTKAVRDKIREALSLNPREPRLILDVLPYYAHPKLAPFVAGLEPLFHRLPGIIVGNQEGDDAFLNVIVGYRNAGAEGSAAYEAIVSAFESTNSIAAVILHLRADNPESALEVVRRSPILEWWKQSLSIFDAAGRLALEASALEQLGRSEEAVAKWKEAAEQLSVGDVDDLRRDWTWQLQEICAKKAGMPKPSRWQPIASLQAMMNGVCVRGALSELTATRVVGARKVKMRQGRISDESGSIAVIFRAETTEMVEDGITVELLDAQVGRDNFHDTLQLTLGKEGTLRVVSKP